MSSHGARQAWDRLIHTVRKSRSGPNCRWKTFALNPSTVTRSNRLVVDQRGSSTLPNASVGVGPELQDSTDSGILIFVAEDLLDLRERVLTAAVARCDPLNLVGIV